MKTLQGDTERIDELERKLKAQHYVQKPFPEEEEIEKVSEKQSERVEESEQTRQDVELAKKLQEEFGRNVQEDTTANQENVQMESEETTADPPIVE